LERALTQATDLAAAGESSRHPMRKVLGLRDLIPMQILLVFGPSWTGTAAQQGGTQVSFWLIGSVLLFLPVAAVVQYCVQIWPYEGGAYQMEQTRFRPFRRLLERMESWRLGPFDRLQHRCPNSERVQLCARATLGVDRGKPRGPLGTERGAVRHDSACEHPGPAHRTLNRSFWNRRHPLHRRSAHRSAVCSSARKSSSSSSFSAAAVLVAVAVAVTDQPQFFQQNRV